MLNLLKTLRQDENGVILSAEIVIVGSLLVVGLITGLTCLQQAVNSELKDLAGALGSLDQSYAYSAHRKPGFGDQCCAWTAGSSFANCETKADNCTDIVGCAESCLNGNEGCCQNSGHSHGLEHRAAACGSCGGRAGGCGTCGGGGQYSGVHSSGGFSVDGYQTPQKARCIESGVQKMKISEWPLDRPAQTIFPPTTVIESPQPILSYPAHNEILQEATPHHHPSIHEGYAIPHGEPLNIVPSNSLPDHSLPNETEPAQPVPTRPTSPVPSNDPLPMPTTT